MKRVLFPLFAVLLFANFSLCAAQHRYELPPNAKVIEARKVTANRELMLWMIKPTKNPRFTPDDSYTCPENTRGSYWSGKTRVSLVDTRKRRVINTIKVVREYDNNEDSFDVPYMIKAGLYYHVADTPKEQENTPTILHLKDYNSDGKAYEFALFDALACMPIMTTLIGYSERQDKVIQYPIRVISIGDDRRELEISHWRSYLFSTKSNASGRWKYEVDFRGRGGSLNKYDIKYNKLKERFEGTVNWTSKGGEDSLYFSSPKQISN